MSIKSEIIITTNYTKAIYTELQNQGYTLPEKLNLANVVPTLQSTPTPPYDPNNPTLTGLKNAMKSGDYSAFPVGTEFPDTYNGHSSPLILVQYLNSTNNTLYNGAVGALVMRKYADATSPFASSSAGQYYPSSDIKDFMAGNYYNNCSDEIKKLLSDITINMRDGTIHQLLCKWFIPSEIEVGGKSDTNPNTEGIFWDYWKSKTGLSTPSASANTGRIINNLSNSPIITWTRTNTGLGSDRCIGTNGAIIPGTLTDANGVLATGFIAA